MHEVNAITYRTISGNLASISQAKRIIRNKRKRDLQIEGGCVFEQLPATQEATVR